VDRDLLKIKSFTAAGTAPDFEDDHYIAS